MTDTRDPDERMDEARMAADADRQRRGWLRERPTDRDYTTVYTCDGGVWHVPCECVVRHNLTAEDRACERGGQWRDELEERNAHEQEQDDAYSARRAQFGPLCRED